MTIDIRSLDAVHDRAEFDCGSDPLNRYLTAQASQDVRRKVSACFVATDRNSGAIAGYYTLSAASVPLTDLPDKLISKLPRYVSVPAARLGRLAVDTAFQGQGIGGVLLFDALTRAIKSDLMAFAMIVDAKDAAAARFYQHHGFVAFHDHPSALFLPLATAERLID